MHKFNSEFLVELSFFVDGWDAVALREQIPLQVAKTTPRGSKLPLFSLNADKEVLDSLGVKPYLDTEEDIAPLPRTHLYNETKENKIEPKQVEPLNLRGTNRKKQGSKKQVDDDFDPLFKTEICKQWKDGKPCKFGKRCNFAHGIDELRDKDRHKKFKTIYCKKFHETGICPYGSRCSFIHDEPFFSRDSKDRLSCFQKRSKGNQLPLDVHSSILPQFKNIELC